MLILPNHQSHIDAQLMAAIVAQYCEFVPVVSERFLKIPVISSFLKKWNAVAVSDFRGGNRDPNVLKNIFSQVMNALNMGRSVIIYPSGTITFTPTEKIHNKQSAYAIVSDLPENTRIVGTRISGLWGSMWSVAWMGERPSFIKALLKGVFYFFANLIYFSPKRNVTFEFVDITDEAKKMAQSDRRTFNQYLEAFYNVNGPEKATYIKHLFFFPRSRRKYPKNLSQT
ncbi:MAG: 1-acyl-sn-glycerol-3-phosphate acyltransferase [Flavobacteriales bacterium]|nr:1-acyl-sn-glycerol-3-phosphate acyltransferase [Flavobacteriales bacterium]